MAYSKKTWVDGEVITDEALNNIENGIETVDTALENKAGKGEQITSPDATSDASGSTVDPTEFQEVVTLVNELKQKLNSMNGFVE